MKKKDQFEIIISQVNWIGGDSKENRLGLTSAYYNNINSEFKLKNSNDPQKIRTKVIIKDSNFRIPSNGKNMILFSTGTGVAPYIGFLQELEIMKKEGKDINKTILLFGSKNKNYDFIYEKEILQWENEKIIEKLYTAFSRDQEQKNYIQNAFVQNYDEIKALLDDCYIFVCGGVSMGNSLNKELENKLGKEFMHKMEKDGKYIKEFWGK